MHWGEWYVNYKAGILEMWQNRVHMYQLRMQGAAVLFWSHVPWRDWQLLKYRMWNEWVRVIASRRRTLIRKKFRLRIAASGFALLQSMYRRARLKLKLRYLTEWHAVIQQQSLTEKLDHQNKRAARAAVLAVQRQAASSAAASMVSLCISDRYRAQRAWFFYLWLGNQIERPSTQEDTPSESPNQQNQQHKCRHHSRIESKGDGSPEVIGCFGLMDAEDANLKPGQVVCEVCAQWCGCGRPGCGHNPEADSMRVLHQKPVVDRRWCRQERRWAALEQEEWHHRGGNNPDKGQDSDAD